MERVSCPVACVSPEAPRALRHGSPSICGGDWGRYPVDAWHPVIPADVVFVSDVCLFVPVERIVDLADIVPAFDMTNESYMPSVEGVHVPVTGLAENYGVRDYDGQPQVVNVIRPPLLRAYRRV